MIRRRIGAASVGASQQYGARNTSHRSEDHGPSVLDKVGGSYSPCPTSLQRDRRWGAMISTSTVPALDLHRIEEGHAVTNLRNQSSHSRSTGDRHKPEGASGVEGRDPSCLARHVNGMTSMMRRPFVVRNARRLDRRRLWRATNAKSSGLRTGTLRGGVFAIMGTGRNLQS